MAVPLRQSVPGMADWAVAGPQQKMQVAELALIEKQVPAARRDGTRNCPAAPTVVSHDASVVSAWEEQMDGGSGSQVFDATNALVFPTETMNLRDGV